GEKEGIDTGIVALNPATGEQVPVWLANFVLPDYGTGAIMAVPAHDERDFEFARQYGLPIRPVVQPPAGWLRATKVYQSVYAMRPADDDTDAIGPDSATEGRGDNIPPTLHDSTPVNRAAYEIWTECRG